LEEREREKDSVLTILLAAEVVLTLRSAAIELTLLSHAADTVTKAPNAKTSSSNGGDTSSSLSTLQYQLVEKALTQTRWMASKFTTTIGRNDTTNSEGCCSTNEAVTSATRTSNDNDDDKKNHNNSAASTSSRAIGDVILTRPLSFSLSNTSSMQVTYRGVVEAYDRIHAAITRCFSNVIAPRGGKLHSGYVNFLRRYAAASKSAGEFEAAAHVLGGALTNYATLASTEASKLISPTSSSTNPSSSSASSSVAGVAAAATGVTLCLATSKLLFAEAHAAAALSR
jgi:hypothetical protein